MGEEKPSVEEERATARQWVRAHYDLIFSSLKHRLDMRLAEYSTDRQTALAEEHLSDDPFSNRFCGVWVFDIPEDELGPMQRIGANRPREKTVHFKDASTGENTQRGHTYLGCGRIIVDAVMGQFTDLDKAIAKKPNLFIGRIFVGMPQEASHNFHVRY